MDRLLIWEIAMLMHPSQILRTASAMLLLCAVSASAQETANNEHIGFQNKLAVAVTPIAGNQGGILQVAEARYINTFRRSTYYNASFDTYRYSNDVGGVLLRDQPVVANATLKLEQLKFELDERKNPAVVLINVSAAGEQAELSVEASLVALAARMAADDRLVLLSMAVGSGTNYDLTPEQMLAIHPAVARHRLAISAAIIDDSLGAENVEAAYWVLGESPWQLSAKAFTPSADMFTLECRGIQTKVEIPNLTARWKRTLNLKQQTALQQLQDFVAVYRLINAAAEGHLQGFPEQEFLSLLKTIQPHYEAQAITIEEERNFHRWLVHR
jgi:hypothetical protein